MDDEIEESELLVWGPFLWFVTSTRAGRFFANWGFVTFFIGYSETDDGFLDEDDEEYGGGRRFRVDISGRNPNPDSPARKGLVQCFFYHINQEWRNRTPKKHTHTKNNDKEKAIEDENRTKRICCWRILEWNFGFCDCSRILGRTRERVRERERASFF